MPLIDGIEVFSDEKSSRNIQKNINSIPELTQELKTDIDPKKIDLDSDLIDNGSMDMFFDQNEFSGESSASNRKDRYNTYREMDKMEFIHRGIEIIADDSTQPNDDNNVIKVLSDDENLKKTLNDLFINKLDMNNELWSIFYETVKIGDNFYEIIPDDYKKPKEIRRIRYLECEKMERIEKEGKLSHFVYKIEKKDPSTNKLKESIEYRLFPWQIIHFKIENKEHSPYGGSLLESGIRTYRRLIMLEDLMLVYRISRAPERRVFYIDVGNLNPVEAKRFLTKMKNAYRSQSFIDENGNINKKANVMSITSDIFVPIKEGSTGTRIETLQGGSAMGASGSEDPLLKYFKDKILRTMNIPPAYMGEQADHSRSLCLHPDTKIKLADGRNLSIKKVSEEFKDGKENFVYSIKEGEWKIKPIKWAGETRKNAELVEVELDNGETIKATPDHKFMLRDGSYCEAKDLKEKTSLMPIYSKKSSKEKGDKIEGYEMLFNNNSGKYEYTHRITKKDELNEENEKKNLYTQRKTTVHHIDFNKLNNNPSNLLLMTNKEHFKYHQVLAKTFLQTPEVIKKRTESLKRYYKTEEGKRSSKERIKKMNDSENKANWNKSEKNKELLSKRSKQLWKDESYRKKLSKRGYITEEEILSTINKIDNDSLIKISKELNINRMTLRYIIQDFGYKNWKTFILSNFNDYKALKTKTKNLNIEDIKTELLVH